MLGSSRRSVPVVAENAVSFALPVRGRVLSGAGLLHDRAVLTQYGVSSPGKCSATLRRFRPRHVLLASAVDIRGQSERASEAVSESSTSCGFAALIGPSNSGKSTLLNLLVGQKIAIVTPKVQTTRCRIAGIVTEAKVMTIYLDTPGVFKARGRLDRAMVRAAWGSAKGADVVAVIVDGAELYHGGKRRRDANSVLYVSDALDEVLRRCPLRSMDICVCLNKVDTIPSGKLSEVLGHFQAVLTARGMPSSTPVFPMAAKTGEGVSEFVSWVRSRMPCGPWLYPEEDLTDMPMRLIAAEVTREKVFRLLRHELPYETAVETTSYVEKPDGSIQILQDVIVSRSSHKGIVMGKGGAMVKSIGTAARQELSAMMDCNVHLMLTVKVREKWKDDPSSYRAWGLDYNA